MKVLKARKRNIKPTGNAKIINAFEGRESRKDEGFQLRSLFKIIRIKTIRSARSHPQKIEVMLKVKK